MVDKVPLEGLNIVNARGRWYVYPRGGGPALVKGFVGTRKELIAYFASPEGMQVYNRPRLQKRLAVDFGADTLGGLIHWFTCGAIDGKEGDGYPKWSKLAPATRKNYLAAYEYMRPEYDIPLAQITRADLYVTRDTAANEKWPSFADHLITALSTMFTQAVKRSKMPFNPCTGIDKLNETDPAANREWTAAEWQYVRDNAPLEILIPCMLARYAGLRGQTLVGLRRDQLEDHPMTGKAVRYSARKNGVTVLLPVLPELQSFLAEIKVQRADGLIAVRAGGGRWPDEKLMQVMVSRWLRKAERAGKIGAGTTLHGLRVTYAAWLSRAGASDKEVAAALGDRSERMGKHYTRHVEAEASIIRAFSRIKGEK